MKTKKTESILPWSGGRFRDPLIAYWDSISNINLCQECGSVVFEFTKDNHADLDWVSIRSWWKFFRHYSKKTLAFKCE